MHTNRCRIYPPMKNSHSAPDLVVDGSNRHGTLGGIIMLNGSDGDTKYSFGITAAHLFESTYEDSFEPTPYPVSITFCDSDDEDMDDEYLDLEQFHALKKGSSNLTTTVSVGNNDTTSPIVAHIFSHSKTLDWALLEMESLEDIMQNVIENQQYPSTLFITRIEESPPNGYLLVKTRRGVIEGMGNGETPVRGYGDSNMPAKWSLQLKSSYFGKIENLIAS